MLPKVNSAIGSRAPHGSPCGALVEPPLRRMQLLHQLFLLQHINIHCPTSNLKGQKTKHNTKVNRIEMILFLNLKTDTVEQLQLYQLFLLQHSRYKNRHPPSIRTLLLEKGKAQKRVQQCFSYQREINET